MPSVVFSTTFHDTPYHHELEVSPLSTPSVFDEYRSSIDDTTPTFVSRSAVDQSAASRHQNRLFPGQIHTEIVEGGEMVRVSTETGDLETYVIDGVDHQPSQQERSINNTDNIVHTNDSTINNSNNDNINNGNNSNASSPSEDEDYTELDFTSFFGGAFNGCNSNPAVDLSTIHGPRPKDCTLEFDIVQDDGGRYSAIYGVENMLRNDNTVYCSERNGAINILLRYSGWKDDLGPVNSQSCVVSHMVVVSPHYGFTAPCKEGMVFISHSPIDVEKTSRFDQFTKHDYEDYVANGTNGGVDDVEPVAWFTLPSTRLAVIDLNDRSAKYILIKLLRAEQESENIDIQYVGFIGYAGPRSFVRSPNLC